MQQQKTPPRPRYVGTVPDYTLTGDWHRARSEMSRGVRMRACLNVSVSAGWPFFQLGRAWRIELRHSRLARWGTLAVVPNWVEASQLYLEAEQAHAFAQDRDRARRAVWLDLTNARQEAQQWRRPSEVRQNVEQLARPTLRRFRVTV